MAILFCILSIVFLAFLISFAAGGLLILWQTRHASGRLLK